MKAKLDRESCISCGLCAMTCPEVFQMADDGVAEVYQEEVPPAEAGDTCACSAGWLPCICDYNGITKNDGGIKVRRRFYSVKELLDPYFRTIFAWGATRAS